MDDMNHREMKKYSKLKEEIRQKDLKNKKVRARINAKIRFVKYIFMIMILFLVYKVGFIKIKNGVNYTLRAVENQSYREQQQTIPPNRGIILDRNKQNLVISNILYRIRLDVRLIAEADKKDQEYIDKGRSRRLTSDLTFEALCEITGMAEDWLKDIISRNHDGSLKNDTNWYDLGLTTHDKAVQIEESTNIKHVYLRKETERNYIYDNLAPQLIGFLRGDNKWGIEKTYNSFMQGEEGRYYSGGSKESLEAIDGSTVVTTIDFNIQQYAQRACDAMQEEYSPENTSVIVMNPMTGEILAMAQSPTFNLNDPANFEFFSDETLKENWDTMNEQERSDALNRVWNNYNVLSTFEPGSIFKPMVIAAALEENIITPETPKSYFCSGSRTYAGWEKPLQCHLKSGHGQQDLDAVLYNSCNVAMMEIGEMIGSKLFYKYQKEFGFGEKTGIDLSPEESGGNVVFPLSDMGPVQLATSSFGQGSACTPIQAINAFAAVINGGNLMRPYVVSQVIDSGGNVKFENVPSVTRKVISKETSDYLRESLVKVVSVGTGKKAAIEGYNIGGKTGTGQQGVRADEKYTVSFIAYLPAENPEVLAMTLINKPAVYVEGSTSAAPKLREVLLDIIKYRGISPASETEAAETGAAVKVLENYIGKPLKDAIASLNMQGIDFDIRGVGGSVVSEQFPGAGSGMDTVSRVVITASETEGEALTAVPYLIGLSAEEAIDNARHSNLVPVTRGLPDGYTESRDDEDENPDDADTGYDAEPEPVYQWRVRAQMPEADIKVPPGTQIVIVAE